MRRPLHKSEHEIMVAWNRVGVEETVKSTQVCRILCCAKVFLQGVRSLECY